MTNKQVKKRIVTDEFGQKFELKSKLGEGGQGLVCATQFENVLVKINTQSDQQKKRKWVEHIRWLMQQPLEDMNVAKPLSRIAMNENSVGYVMELMDGLMPLQQFMDTTEEAMDGSEYSLLEYLASGGIKRRMQILSKLSRTLAGLHAKGLAFGDLSPANIFISKQTPYSEVWLIDCDNICVNQRESYDSVQLEGKAGKVFSPGYGAPEVVNGDRLVSSLTDSWSFGVIAMKLLTTNHPFVGEIVESGTPEEQDIAFAGGFPWIYHPTDTSNQLNIGIPIDVVTLKPLRDLFERCFNIGKDEPLKRPTLSEWAEVFEQMSNILVNCQNIKCKSTFTFSLTDNKLICPFCDSQLNNSQVLLVRHYLYEQSLEDIAGATKKDAYIDAGDRQTVNLGESIVIKDSPPGSIHWADSKESIEVSFTDSGLLITPLQADTFEMGLSAEKLQTFTSATELPLTGKKNRTLFIKPHGSKTDENVVSLFGFRW